MKEAKTVNEGVWVVEESIALDSLTIAEGASLAAPEGKSLTMTVNGIGTEIRPGAYKGDIFLSVADSLFIQPASLYKNEKPKEFRAAVVVDDGKYIAEKSIPAIVKGGRVTDSETTGVTIFSREESFNGIIIKGDSEYTIEGVKIDFEGDGGNDFIGYGAGIACLENSKVTINNSDIKLHGVTRCAIHVGENSVTTVNNCRLFNDSPATDKMNPLWALGLRGTNRVTMLADYATVYYNDCQIIGNGWGALAIDGPIHTRMYVKDSTIELTGPRARGYGAFSIGDCLISFDNCTLDVQGYPLLLGGSAMNPGENKSNCEFTGGSVVNSTLYGILIFRAKGGDIDVKQGTVFNTASSVFVVKGASPRINIDNAILNPGNGVILQLMDSDEPGMGPSSFKPPIGEVDVPIPGRDLAVAQPDEDVFMTVSNIEVKGDFYNSTTNLRANCRASSPGGPHVDSMPDREAPMGLPEMDNEAQQGVKNLDLKFSNARVEGVISAAAAAYKEGITVIDISNCEELSAVTQTAREPVNNGVIVSFDKNCVWKVTGTSYLTSLSIEQGAVIKATEEKNLAMTVDGVETAIAPGSYTGKIVLKIA